MFVNFFKNYKYKINDKNIFYNNLLMMYDNINYQII